MNIEHLVKQSGGEVRQPEAHYTEYVFSPKSIESLRETIIKDFVSGLEPVGYARTNKLHKNFGTKLYSVNGKDCNPLFDLSKWR